MKTTTTSAAMREVLATWESSGLSLRAFGKREGIAYAKLLYWKKRVAPRPVFTPVEIVEAPAASAQASPGIISIWLANGISLEVPPSVAEGDLARMVRVLSAC